MHCRSIQIHRRMRSTVRRTSTPLKLSLDVCPTAVSLIGSIAFISHTEANFAWRSGQRESCISGVFRERHLPFQNESENVEGILRAEIIVVRHAPTAEIAASGGGAASAWCCRV